MDFELNVPIPGGTALPLTISPGQTLFVLGANGTGKSGLMTQFYGGHQQRARRISAHRQTWMNSNAISLSPEQKRNQEIGMVGNDAQPTARWRDDFSTVRPSIAIYDLIDAENVRARDIAGAVDGDDMTLAKVLSSRRAPIKIINELLRLSNIPVEISVKESDQIIASKSGGAPYSIAELSDGERSALLVAATVLTAKPGTLILIDEPERHLHRSIISPLLTHLFARRPDCAFVISTHDVNLPLDNPTARTLLVRGCALSGNAFVNWDVDLVPPGAAIDEDLKRDILGARRKLLFVEGEARSLDKPLYTAVFKDVSVITRGSSRDVEHAVDGVRGARDLHWLHAFGIVDNDGRSQGDIDQLKGRGIYALSVFSVESVYYEPEIQRRVAERHGAGDRRAGCRLGRRRQSGRHGRDCPAREAPQRAGGREVGPRGDPAAATGKGADRRRRAGELLRRRGQRCRGGEQPAASLRRSGQPRRDHRPIPRTRDAGAG